MPFEVQLLDRELLAAVIREALRAANAPALAVLQALAAVAHPVHAAQFSDAADRLAAPRGPEPSWGRLVGWVERSSRHACAGSVPNRHRAAAGQPAEAPALIRQFLS